MPSTVKGFATMYALLALTVLGAGLGAYAAYTDHGLARKVSHVQAAVGDENLTRLADQAITTQAQQAGLGVKRIVVKSARTAGARAVVDAVVTLTDGVSDRVLDVVVSFTRSTWQVSNLVAK